MRKLFAAVSLAIALRGAPQSPPARREKVPFTAP